MTTTSTLDQPTTIDQNTLTPPTPTAATGHAGTGARAGSLLQVLDRIGRAVREAGSVPSHPYLTQAVGPTGAVLWATGSGFLSPETTDGR